MPEIKNNFVQGKMNKDLDDRLLPNGQYRDAKNITVSKSENSDVGTVQNIKGNVKLFNDNLNLPTSAPFCETIGKYVDSLTGEIFWFVTNFDGTASESSSLVNYAGSSFVCKIFYSKPNGTFKTLVDSYRLNFSKQHPITHLNRLDDLLFWTDNYNQPRKIEIDKALGDNNPYSNDVYLEDKISVAQYAPYAAPKVELSYDSSIKSKTIEEEFVKFSYRFKYDNNEYSLMAPFTQHCFHPGKAAQTFNDGTYSTSSSGMAGVLTSSDISDIAKTTVVNNMVNKANKVSLLITLPFDESISSHATAKVNNGSGLSGTTHTIDTVAGTIAANNIMLTDNNDLYVINSFTAGNPNSTLVTTTSISPAIANNTDLYFFNVGASSPYGWSNKLKIKEIEILYSESDSTAIKVIDIIKVGTSSLTIKPIIEVISSTSARLRYTYEYIYKSTKATKTLPEADLIRVSDIIPVKAKTQEISGNRIIYGNFLQNRNTDDVFDTSSITIGSGDQSLKNKEYLLSSVKSNRTYQVGIVLSDRYGRQSPVILPDESTSFVDPKTGVVTNGSNSWNHSCLKTTFNTPLGGDIYNSTDNRLGWYSYRFVVKQTEQDYYNVYSPQVLEAGTLTSATDRSSFVLLHGDNINKVPRDVTDVNAETGNQGSNIRLLPKIKENNVLQAGYTNLQQQTGADFIEVTSIGTALEQGLTEKLDGGNADDVLNEVYLKEKNPLFAQMPTGLGSYFSTWVPGTKAFSLYAFETQPFVSSIDIYYETSSCGLLQDLKDKIAASAGEAPTDITVNSTTFSEADTSGSSICTFTAKKSNGDPVQGGASFAINSITDGLGNSRPGIFAISGSQLVTATTFNFKNTSADQFVVSVTATRNNTSETYTRTHLITLQNVAAKINVGSGNNVSNTAPGVTIAAVQANQNTSITITGLNGGLANNTENVTFTLVSQTNTGRYSIDTNTGVISANVNLSNGMADTLVLKSSDIAGSNSPNTSLKITVTGSPYTQFWRSANGNATASTAVDEPTGVQVWHNGNNALPQQNDIVYSNATGTTVFSTGSATDGSGGVWHSMCGPNYCSHQVANFVFKTSSDGVVRAVTLA